MLAGVSPLGLEFPPIFNFPMIEGHFLPPGGPAVRTCSATAQAPAGLHWCPPEEAQCPPTGGICGEECCERSTRVTGYGRACAHPDRAHWKCGTPRAGQLA